MMIDDLKNYGIALKHHPGTSIATVLSLLGFVAGAKGGYWFIRGMVGFAIMSLFWIPVLWTAWVDRNNP